MPVTSYMSLSLPTASVSVGPAWAIQLNAALVTVDAHDHTSGSGKPVRAAALSIDADVAFGGFNLTGLRSLRLANQGAALALGTDLGCVFESGGDLFWNNSSGQHVQITSGAALNAASLGGIGGDYSTSTASMFYTAAATTFSLWSASNKYASLDMGSIILREPGATSPKGITLKSPTSLAADYALTLPAALPAATLPLLVSNAGVLSTSSDLSLPGTLVVTGAATLNGGLTLTGQLTRANLPTVGQQKSTSTGSFSTSSTSFVDVTNATVTITTTGRPVVLSLQPDGDVVTPGNVAPTGSSASALRMLRDGNPIALYAPTINVVSPGWILVDATPAAGAHTYKLQAGVIPAGGTIAVTKMVLVAYEL